jgi:hypothetical protein
MYPGEIGTPSYFAGEAGSFVINLGSRIDELGERNLSFTLSRSDVLFSPERESGMSSFHFADKTMMVWSGPREGSLSVADVVGIFGILGGK